MRRCRLLLPLLMTRYTWPPHYVTALPAVAFAPRRARTAAFFAAMWRPLEPLGAAGPLLAGIALLAGGAWRDRIPPEDVAASGKNVP